MKFIGFLILTTFAIIWFYITFSYFQVGVDGYNELSSSINFLSFVLLSGIFVFGFFFGKIFTSKESFVINHSEKKSTDISYTERFDFSKVLDSDIGIDNVEVDDLNDSILIEKQGLQVIEGIGPKIEELLNDFGIDTLEELSLTSVSYLENIINKAGNKFAMHDPKTWPEQARLAYEGKWKELKDFK